MQRIFQIIKKKKNLRRISVVFLALVVIELFSHAQSGKKTFAAELSSTVVGITISNESKDKRTETAVTIPDNHRQDPEQTPCNDETSHHDIIISNFSHPLKKAFFRSERIAFNFGEPIYNSLPPPYLPPKNF